MTDPTERDRLVARLRAVQYAIAALVLATLSVSAALMPDGQNFSLIFVSLSVVVLGLSFLTAKRTARDD